MKKAVIAVCALSLCLASCKKEEKIINTAAGNDTVVAPATDTVAEKPLDSVAMREAWQEYATPGEAHKMMADETGTWDVAMKFWSGPETVSESSTAVAEARMVLGGHYQEVVYKGTMMGMPFEGKSTLAYNNKNAEYTSTWIDNMATGMLVTKGTYDTAAKTINLIGSMPDPVDGKNVRVREVYSFVDANTRKMESFDTKEGKKEFKSMEIVMKRKK